MNQRQCPSCKAPAQITLLDALKKISRLECKWCGYVEDFAEYEISQPTTTPQQANVWGLLFVGACLFGVAKLVDSLA
jgi:Zn ribbon nucleic-acid-binding protein